MSKAKQQPTAQNQFTVEREKKYPILGGDIIEIVATLEELPIRFSPIVDMVKQRLMRAMQKADGPNADANN